MSAQDLVISFTVVGAMSAFAAWAGRAGVPPARAFCGTAAFGCGALTVLLMIVGHSMLSQVLLLVPGVVCVGESVAVARGVAAAHRRALQSAAVIAALAAPLGGFGPMAIILTGLAGAAVSAILSAHPAGRRRTVYLIGRLMMLLSRFPERTRTAVAAFAVRS
jgi:hypothetical protein